MENEIEFLKNEVKSKECQINELQSYIDRLKAELEETQQNSMSLSLEPIKIADWLIDRLRPEKLTIKMVNGNSFNTWLIHKSELRQIAEHLLVYCNHAEVE